MKRLSKPAAYPYLSMRKHYGFAIHNADEIYRYLSRAQKLKNSESDCFITWFASEESEAVLRDNLYIDQIVVLEGSAKLFHTEIPRLQAERSWSGFFTSGSNVKKEFEDKVSTSQPRAESQFDRRILLGQLVSNGDCLYTTTLARQIKHDYPGCHLTWAVSSLCRGMVEGNPFVDEIWEIPVGNRNQWAAAWYQFEQEAQVRVRQGEFDEIFLTQIYPDNYQNYDGTIRPSIFRAYPKPITVPIQNILRLRDDEVERVRIFAEQHNLLKRSHVILFECAPESSQSFVTPDYALGVAQGLLSHLPDCSIILSSNVKILTGDMRIIDGSVLSLRENAELTKYCTLFIGCSSGITQIALTDWAKQLPIIQLLLASTSMYASIAHDLEYWGYSSEQILEMTDSPPEHLSECVYTALTQGFSEARRQFHQQTPIHFNFYLTYIREILLQRGQYVKTARALLYAVERYGWHQQLKTFMQTELFPNVSVRTPVPVADEDCSKFLQKFISATDVSESNLLPDSEQFLSALSRQAYQYQQDPTAQSVLASLRQARKQIAELWVSLPTEQLASSYFGVVGKAHHSLLNTGIKDEALTDSEQTFVDEVTAHLVKGMEQPKAICYLLAAMLYRRADRLPLQHDLTHIPQWLLNDYLKYMFNSPLLFKEVGEADNYYHYMQRCMDYLHTSILSNPDSSVWRSVVTEFSQIANFIPLYFNEVNLKDIYVKRAELLEWVLNLKGYEVDYEFEDRPVTRKKTRIGILAAHFTPAAETFASLPVYEYISREYEVILYSLSLTGHPLEQYCQSCANSFKLLPKDLSDQVNLIRADNLDFLYIATNVTAVTNQICLISLHRLARVQVISVGSVVTTGMRHIDYYISGQITEPMAEAEQHYREKLVKLDGTAHCFSYGSEQEEATVKVERDSLGISEETIVFISGANFFKITPKLIDTWAKIIAAVPNSVLVLLPFGPNWSNAYPKKAFLNHLSTIFSKHEVVTDRLIVLDPQPVPNREDVKEYFKIANVYLDSYPFSGTTSLIEPLEVGLSIVSRQGKTFRSSMGAAMLQALNIPDLVTDSDESYIQLAIALGTNPELRQQKSAQIKQRMQANPSFLDSRSYSAQMETLFQELFRKHQVIALTDSLKLRNINLIIFPDWSQPEDVLYQDIAGVITSLVNHPENNQITLLIDTGNLSEDEANLLLSDIVMNLLLAEDLDVTNGPEISLVRPLGRMQWEVLLTRIYARIILENENQQVIVAVKAETISSSELNSFSSNIDFRKG